MDNPNDSPPSAVTIPVLGGRVLKTSLPTVHGRPPPNSPRLKRLMLAQGELAHLWDGAQPIHYIAFLELRPGTLRGNHLHHAKHEFFYVIAGRVEVFIQDESGRKDSAMLEAGELVEIPAGIAHCFKIRDAGQALEFSEARFDPADVFPHEVVASGQ